LLARTPA